MNNSLNNSINKENEELENSDDMLSYIKKFSLEKKKPSLKEQLLQDEAELKLKLMNLNSKKEIKDKILNYKRTSSNKQSNSTFDCSYNGVVSLNIETDDLITHNIIIEEKFIKCILIGDKQVGKSLFKNKIIEEEHALISTPQPTCTLDIKKKLIYIKSTPVRFEIWDTNTQIQNSPIIQSKLHLINIYSIL
jgi:hypothetical protein